MNIINTDITNINNINIDKNLLNGFYSINELLECVRNLRQKINKPLYYPLNNIELFSIIMIFYDGYSIIIFNLNFKII